MVTSMFEHQSRGIWTALFKVAFPYTVYLASLCASGISSADMEHRVERAREQFNHSVPDSKAVAEVSFSTIMESPPKQASLSAVLEDLDQAALWEASPPTTRLRLLAVTAPGAPDWLKV